MNCRTLTTFVVAALVSACVAVGTTLAVLRTAQPQPVQAAPDKQELRIAIVNLERVCRETPTFRTLKRDWENAQAEFKSWNAKLEDEYRRTVALAREADKAGMAEDLLVLRVEAQGAEQALKVAKEEQAEYLDALLAEFQSIVLEEVLRNVKKFARQEGFNIVLQDYDDPAGDEDFFTAKGYAQAVMSKTVLDAPWALEGDPHVTDVTQIMINHMRAGGVPDKKKD